MFCNPFNKQNDILQFCRKFSEHINPLSLQVISDRSKHSTYKPSIGLHLLQQYLASRHDWDIQLLYTNLSFHDYLPSSFERDLLIRHFWDNPCLFWFSEGFFASHAYNEPEIRNKARLSFLDRTDYIRQLPEHKQPYPAHFIEWLNNHIDDVHQLVHEGIPDFLSDFACKANKFNADLVGFGFFYNQTFPALAMSKAIRDSGKKHPFIVLGGASITKENTPHLLEHFSQVDFIIEGEGEIPLERLCEWIETHDKQTSLNTVPSLFFRSGTTVATTPNATGRFVEVDALPSLDYSAYFQAAEHSSFQNIIRSAPYETTRGCYWERHSKCSFCGFAHDFPFRMKSPELVLKELSALLDNNDVDYYVCADACLPKKQMRHIIPALVEMFRKKQKTAMFFFEVRADLKREDIVLFSQLGTVVLQAGIESFHTESLKLMRKGIDALTNIQFLKWCKIENICLFYNLLYGHPGEPPEMYDETCSIIESILHLDAPQSCMMVMLLRNSPLYDEAEKIGIKA